MKTIEEASKDTAHNRGIFMSDLSSQAEIGFRSGVAFAQRWIPLEEFKDYSDNDNILVKFDDGSIRRFTEEFPFAIATHCRLINIE